MKPILLTFTSTHPHLAAERVDICVQTDGGVTIDTATERFTIARDPSAPYRNFSRFITEWALPAVSADWIDLNKLAVAAEGRLL
jgi:hypothetical protein